MKQLVALGGLAMLAGCGGGTTTGENYSEAPPMAEIVATPTPAPSESATPEAAAPAAPVAPEAPAAPEAERRFDTRPAGNSM